MNRSPKIVAFDEHLAALQRLHNRNAPKRRPTLGRAPIGSCLGNGDQSVDLDPTLWGHVVESGVSAEGEAWYRIACIRAGRVEFRTLADSSVDWSAFGGQVDPKGVVGLIQALCRQVANARGPKSRKAALAQIPVIWRLYQVEGVAPR